MANDYASHPRAIDIALSRGVKSAVALPIKASGHVSAVITVESSNPHYFTPNRVRLLTAVANGLGALLENVQLSEQLDAELEHSRRRDPIGE